MLTSLPFDPGPDINNPDVVSVIDEISLWSAPFGLSLLKAVRLRRGISALDVGCGTGFPMLELAQRLGESCHVTGIDPWDAALRRLKTKIGTMKIRNATPVSGRAEQMPFNDKSFDLIVSNNGINNVQDPEAAMAECFRVARSGAQLVVTVNLPDTMREFYDVFEDTLRSLDLNASIASLREHIYAKRKPLTWLCDLVTKVGFVVDAVSEESFSMRYLDGTTMFKHFLIRLAFLDPWKAIPPPAEMPRVFRELEERLNHLADREGELRLTVPYVCLSASKP